MEGKPEVADLFDTVIDNDYCIGCGACASTEESPIDVKLNEHGQYEAAVDADAEQANLQWSPESVCPFSNQSKNEDEISEDLFETQKLEYNSKVGYYSDIYAGYVYEGNYREVGSSGGVATWLLTKLMNMDEIDGVIHVKPTKAKESKNGEDVIFEYGLSTTTDGIFNGAKSRYYPVEYSEAVKIVRDRPGDYAIVGVPCFIKSIRLLQDKDSIVNDRIKYCISIFCGQLKSKRFAELYAWRMGLDPSDLDYIDFRKEFPKNPANRYGVEAVESKSGNHNKEVDSAYDVIDNPWGLGYFKYNACDYCDDIVGEVADISLGDAWLPEFVEDSSGTSIVILRDNELADIFNEHIGRELHMGDISTEEVVKAQESNYQHRRDELPYRLHLAEKNGGYYPHKRVEPSDDDISEKRKRKQKLKMEISNTSHEAYLRALEEDDLGTFDKQMNPLVTQYYDIGSPLWKRIGRRIPYMKTMWDWILRQKQ